jgi:hypothetical protein
LWADVTCHLERTTRALEFHRTGRHAAAERLLRDVAGAAQDDGTAGPRVIGTARLAIALASGKNGGGMDLDPTFLMLSLIPSGIGFVLFTYGRKSDRWPQLVAGLVFMVYP